MGIILFNHMNTTKQLLETRFSNGDNPSSHKHRITRLRN